MEEYRKALISLKNLLIRKNNEDLELIRKNNEESVDCQTLYMNSISFNLFKNNNIHLRNILSVIYYKIFKKQIEKALLDIILDYEFAVLELHDRVDKRRNEIEKINQVTQLMLDSENEKIFEYSIKKNNI